MSNTEIIGVRFRKGEELSSRVYSYYALEEYEVGEVVKVPVKGSMTDAVVAEKNIKFEDVPEYLRPFLKDIPPQSKSEADIPTKFETEDDDAN